MFNFNKIFNQAPKKNPETTKAANTEQKLNESTEINNEQKTKTLEEYIQEKEELVKLYEERSEAALNYHTKKDKIKQLNPDEELKKILTDEAHRSTLGEINEKITEISKQGIQLTPHEHLEARKKMITDEIDRVNEKIKLFRETYIYPQNKRAQELLSLKKTIENKWDKDMLSIEEKDSILIKIFGEKRAQDAGDLFRTLSSKNLFKEIDQELSKMELKGSDLRNIELSDLYKRQEKLRDILIHIVYNAEKKVDKNIPYI